MLIANNKSQRCSIDKILKKGWLYEIYPVKLSAITNFLINPITTRVRFICISTAFIFWHPSFNDGMNCSNRLTGPETTEGQNTENKVKSTTDRIGVFPLCISTK